MGRIPQTLTSMQRVVVRAIGFAQPLTKKEHSSYWSAEAMPLTLSPMIKISVIAIGA